MTLEQIISLLTQNSAQGLSLKPPAKNEITSAFRGLLKQPSFEPAKYEQIITALNILKQSDQLNQFQFLIPMALARAPTEDDMNKLIDIFSPDIDAESRSELTNKRNIWQKISALEAGWKSNLNKKSAKEKWDIVKRLLVGQNKDGKVVAGKAQHSRYWIESNPDSSGRYVKNADATFDWMQIWKSSRVDLSFADWIAIVAPEYLTTPFQPETRKLFELTVKQGLLYDSTNALADTSNSQSITKNSSIKGVVECVLSLDDKLYSYGTAGAKKAAYAADAKHSWMLEGQPVKFAGELQIQNGRLVKITMRSGHYQPSDKHLFNFLEFLHRSKINLSGVPIYDWDLQILHKDAQQFFIKYKPKMEDTKTKAPKTSPPGKPAPSLLTTLHKPGKPPTRPAAARDTPPSLSVPPPVPKRVPQKPTPPPPVPSRNKGPSGSGGG